jgi:hypothetical protein
MPVVWHWMADYKCRPKKRASREEQEYFVAI